MPPAPRSVTVTLQPFEIVLTLSDEGLVVDVWQAGKEDTTGGPVASTYAFYREVQEEEEQ